MPMSYRFTAIDGTIPTLDSIDRELCERSGYPYSATNYCPAFTFATQILGFCIVKHGDGDKTSAESFDAFKLEHDARPEEERFGLTDAEWRTMREFLAERYTLELWYSVGR